MARRRTRDRPALRDIGASIDAVRTADQLSAEQRAGIASALDYLYMRLLREELGKRRGPPRNDFIALLASVVGALVERHGVKVAAAASAMVREDADSEERRKLQQLIERTYRKLKAAGRLGDVADDLVQAALGRLNPPRKRKQS